MTSLDPLGASAQDQDQPPTSITPAAQGFSVAMQQQAATPPTATTPVAQAIDPSKDIIMTDTMPDRPASPAILPSATNVPSPIPARVGTPSRNTNGNENTSSRATSQHPDPAATMPKEAPPHGAPTRQYLNSKVTGPLMDGMKLLAKEQPKDPLRALGEYLLQRSREIEGT
ncbi:hypothetical protein BKA65DRAFT_533175 [Rhexocercosporidium sp. MPI-PUGE-AT-0058]|nr:hypothetical protein BKA65DRAFT_533175 [Rhexocercosporidium sp. MPI-PUGE-AT-0058]